MKKNFDEKVDNFLSKSNGMERVYGNRAWKDAREAWDYLFSKKNLTTNRILETHRILLKNLDPKIAGKIRKINVSVGNEKLASVNEVPNLFERWIIMCANLSNEEHIKEAHIRFEKIHPFEDGNGRVGRIVLNWQRAKSGMDIIEFDGYEQREYYKWFQ